jgi:hypothetical protein
MKQETETNIDQIMNGLDNEDVSKDVEVVKIKTQAEHLRDTLTDFVAGQINEIKRYDNTIALAITRLNERLLTNELTAAETLNVISTLSNKRVDLTSTLLDPFKPTTTSSPLLPAAKENADSSDIDKALKNMKPDDLKTLDFFYRKLNTIKSTDVE